MRLDQKQLSELAELAVRAASSASAYIQQVDPSTLQLEGMVEHKTAGDTLASQVVTEVDREAQAILHAALRPSCQAFDIGWLAEEDADDGSRFVSDYFWCIDPLDGTLCFIEHALEGKSSREGVGGFAVSVALLDRNGLPQIGVVADPISDRVRHAVRGSETTRSLIRDEHFILFADRSFSADPRAPLCLDSLEKLAQRRGLRGVEIRVEGGAVMNACWVMEHTSACYLKLPKPSLGGGSLWDFAATSCLAHACGASASDVWGKPLDLNRKDSTFMNHRGVLFASTPELATDLLAGIGTLLRL